MASIICKNGPEHTHSSVEESRECWARVIGSNASAGSGVTTPPPPPPAPVTPPVTAEPWAMQPRTRVPLQMLDATPDGYFAVRKDDTDSYQFLRISRKFPKHSKKQGCIQVQRQSSDTLRQILIYRPLDPDNGNFKEWLAVSMPQMEPYVILAMVDPITSGQAYASALGKCMICGKTLTDGRSRWYGIGPECEKDHPEIIEWVEGEKGEYVG